ncbi:MAG TPA: glycosyltransferase family 4 protein [Roseiflexaceae bacterium]|nr:glycosyltransferase family 4 protein [Roseiflexaceae bacterium]
MGHTNGAARRHCMVVHNYYPQREPRVEREAQALVANGYEVDVICLREPGEPAEATVNGVNVYRLPVRRRKGSGPAVQLLEYLAFFAMASARLAALHRRRRYRVVQAHNLPDFLVFAAWLPKLSGARLILDIHDLMPEFFVSRFTGSMRSPPVRLVRLQERLACGFADHVITVTDLWREALIGRGTPPEKVSVVMNVANDRIFRRQAPTPRPADPGCFRLLYHGTLTRRYGIDVAIRAVDIVRRQLPGVHFTVHGAGEERDALARLVEELDLGQHVRVTSHYIPTTEMPAFIQQADLGVVPYRRDIFTDGILPTKLMEYVALGVPVVAARTPVIEAYFDETMVQFFQPEDHEGLARAILALHADRERLALLAQNADRFNQRYSWQQVSAQYLALVDRLHAS